ncbi:hypothetical protein PSTG_04713 [Puccinia striiformis f. sp. tritici PST-78]|uniref:Uncharacterized protein n=1 Tax=Puccinia striiformis f. sp. tritici PST-78 TaxID=1165861 RepID=A0A0L0VSG0_9BASI|nr:hypothetical protein PSTG_04713 [Puccinia striiformis f. sp. tritici PST-78]
MPCHNCAGQTGAARRIPVLGYTASDKVSAHNDVIQEQLKYGGTNLASNLLKLLLICNLTATGSQSFHVNQSASNATNQLKWQQLGKDLSPSFLINKLNFPAWSVLLKDIVGSVVSDHKYFTVNKSKTNLPTSNGVLAIIKFSVNPELHSFLNGMTAPNTPDSISAGNQSIKESLLDLEERLGGWTTDKLLALSFHSSLKQYHQPLADAMDSRIAINPQHPVTSVNLLNKHGIGSSSND